MHGQQNTKKSVSRRFVTANITLFCTLPIVFLWNTFRIMDLFPSTDLKPPPLLGPSRGPMTESNSEGSEPSMSLCARWPKQILFRNTGSLPRLSIHIQIFLFYIRIFHRLNPSSCTVALGSTQPLTEMSTRDISWGGGIGRCVGLTNLPLSCTDCHEIWGPQPSGTLSAFPRLYTDCFT